MGAESLMGPCCFLTLGDGVLVASGAVTLVGLGSVEEFAPFTVGALFLFGIGFDIHIIMHVFSSEFY